MRLAVRKLCVAALALLQSGQVVCAQGQTFTDAIESAFHAKEGLDRLGLGVLSYQYLSSAGAAAQEAVTGQLASAEERHERVGKAATMASEIIGFLGLFGAPIQPNLEGLFDKISDGGAVERDLLNDFASDDWRIKLEARAALVANDVSAGPTAPVNEVASNPTPQKPEQSHAIAVPKPTSSAGWMVSKLSDGRPLATAPLLEGPSNAQTDYFESLSLICTREGGMKIGLHSTTGRYYPSVLFFPSKGGNRFSLTENEITGAAAMYFLQQMMIAEKQVLAKGYGFLDLETGISATSSRVNFNLLGINKIFYNLADQCLEEDRD